MRRYQPYGVILLSLALQIIVSFTYESLFVQRVNEDIAVMEQRMDGDGVPSGHSRHVSAALRAMRHNVSSYVQGQSLQLVFFNGLVLIILFGRQRKEEPSAGH